ncbi:Aspartyl/glutamyl-tRNA(Asn/Gln) amidotransferase subunit B [Paramicrosporidium saccamoebae]|uniref:Aspartyl/glutamyl-tRNA(Asn/Gln) amidotransferase subunit B n=1 Tax=Paramicrosporidium saccamoebae TaxID=1246581 RepID=A0A2H9TIM1_9FUNG|nr:Aspartyl/glutamyl-tRNA(Asn/Gln) amidotransferase subunit B [Paramicrosporidium saccamoebae]
MLRSQTWTTVVGLEIHAQLASRHKLFSVAPNNCDAQLGTCCAPFDAAVPGALPLLNQECVDLALRAAIALRCNIRSRSFFDRKHYRYDDLPLGYQITQHRSPFAVDGVVHSNGRLYKIPRIQIEQDSAKRVGGMLDLNRCGVPLVEVVTAPEIGSASEAEGVARAIWRTLVDSGTTCGVLADGNVRFDVNVSLAGPVVGERVEIKNINTFAGLRRAIVSEEERQRKVFNSGDFVVKETRSWDETSRITLSSREKGNYFIMPEYDLPVLEITDSRIDQVKKELPEGTWERYSRMKELGLSEQEVDSMVDSGMLSIFEECRGNNDPRLVYNFVMNKYLGSLRKFPKGVDVEELRLIISHLATGDIDHPSASITELLKPSKAISASLTLEMCAMLEEMIKKNPKKLAQLREGRDVTDYFMGPLIKTKSGISPSALRPLVAEFLDHKKVRRLLGTFLADGTDFDAVVETLKELQDTPIKREVLEESKLGVQVNKVRKAGNEELAALATGILLKWRDIMLEEGKTTKKRPLEESKVEPPSKDIKKVKDVPSREPTPKDIEKVKDVSSIKPTPKDTISSREADEFKTGDAIRDKCYEMLLSALLQDTTESPTLKHYRICREIEECLFVEFGSTSPAYKAKFRSKYLNLKSTPALRHALLTHLTPAGFHAMNAAEMASEERRRQDSLLAEKNLAESKAVQDTEAETDQFKCGRCGQRKTKYYQLQTRSADEPMTTFVTCINCGNRWKFC